MDKVLISIQGIYLYAKIALFKHNLLGSIGSFQTLPFCISLLGNVYRQMSNGLEGEKCSKKENFQ